MTIFMIYTDHLVFLG